VSTAPPDGPISGRGGVVLLAGPGDTTDIVAHALAARFPVLTVIEEQSPSRTRMARRRALRVGWPDVVGQILFVTLALPVLGRRGAARIRAIEAAADLDATPYPGKFRVDSVNRPDTVELLDRLRPAVIVVNGTRIIAKSVLDAIDCPIINTHAGITPRYRGVHGGYWALAEGRPDQVGTTVHLVDPGIDTGGVLVRSHFDVTPADTIATYPYLHLAAGLPALTAQVDRALSGLPLEPLVERVAEEGSRLYFHPTLWGYLRRRVAAGVK
jgi:folate-dependent phosphoribosylglycinamide formyltransferase PurN